MKSSPISPLFMIARVAACWLVCCVASAQLRIVSWNTNGGARDGTREVLRAIGLESVNGIARPVDLLSLQEQGTGDVESIVAVLNHLYGTGAYAAAPVPDNAATSGAGLPRLVYRTNTVQLLETVAFGGVNTSAQARSTLRYKLKAAYYGDDAAFYVYNNHYKASTGFANEQRRLVEANALRANLDNLGDGTSAVLTGDFNTYDSFEPGYQALLASGLGQAFDPIDAPGNWHDNAAFRAVHTQSPATEPAFPGQVTGGMDDRFDFQLVTGELLDTEGVDLIPGSYRTFGNNGTHSLNGSIGTGTGASPDVLGALEIASDHLPVVADYQVPAVLGLAVPLPPFAAYEVGSEAFATYRVFNAADVPTSAGADELDFRIIGAGDVPQSIDYSSTLLAGSDFEDIPFKLDTSTVGEKEVEFVFETLSPQAGRLGGGAAGALPPYKFVFEVIFSGDYNEDGVVDAADYSTWRDNLGMPTGTLANDPAVPLLTPAIGEYQYQVWRDNYGRRLSDIVGATAAVPEPAAAGLLLIGLLAADRRARHSIGNRQAQRHSWLSFTASRVG